MFAAHLAAGLALRTARPSAPTTALLAGAFLPDFAWICLSGLGMDSGAPADAWSHSAVSMLVLGTAYAALYPVGRDWKIRLLLFCAVLSHLPLDAIIHPQPIQLYPNAPWRAGWDLWSWGQEKVLLGFTRYFVVQAAIVAALLTAYAWRAASVGVSRRNTAVTVLVVAFVHLVT